MSIITGKGYCLTYVEAEVKCPVCEQKFDASKKVNSRSMPVIDMKCPICKSKVTVFFPVMGGELRCWETECPTSVQRLETITKNKVNGVEI